MQSYSHFTIEERACLFLCLKEKKSIRAIAKLLKRNPSSVSREIKRNSDKEGHYTFEMALKLYKIRRKKSVRKSRILEDTQLLAFIQEKLQIFWSPECIVHKFKETGTSIKLSLTTIYNALSKEIIENCNKKDHLRRRGKQKHNNRSQFNAIQPEHTIHDRPEAANSRSRPGDLEGDTILGAHGKGGLVSFVDRLSRFLFLYPIQSKSALETAQAITKALAGYKIHSITLDNGSEFAKFKDIEVTLDTTIYFADPRSPWQRGSNENINGLVRFFFPRSTDFTTLSLDRVQEVVNLINNRPRKCLNWRTPNEVFHGCCT